MFANGTRVTAVQDAIKKFRQGKWESLWKMAMTKAEQLRVKRDKHPNQPRARTDAQKDAYAQKCAKAGNLSKANQTICSELIPSCDENTLPQLQALHPHGDLNFNRQFWPEEQAIRDLFDMSGTRYYQILNGLIDAPEALAYDPLLVKRLRRMRASRQRARSARRLGIEVESR